MPLVRARLIVRRLRMAVDTGERRVVRGNQVAIAAYGAMVRDWEECVAKCRAEPTGRRMATLARCRVSRRDMVRHGAAGRLRAVPGRDVAAVAVCRQRS